MIKAAQDTFVSYNTCLAAVPMPVASEALSEAPKPPQAVSTRRPGSLKRTFAIIAAGTIIGASVRGWLAPEQKQTETATSPAPSTYQNNTFLVDAGIGAAVFGAYSLRGMIVTVFGIKGMRAGWRKLNVDKEGKKKCPFHFDR